MKLIFYNIVDKKQIYKIFCLKDIS